MSDDRFNAQESQFIFYIFLWTYTLFVVRNSFIRNLHCDSQMAKKLSVLKPWRLRNLFLSLAYHNFEDKVTYFDKDMFRKESFRGTNSYSQVKHKLKNFLICFQLSNRVFFLSVVLF